MIETETQSVHFDSFAFEAKQVWDSAGMDYNQKRTSLDAWKSASLYIGELNEKATEVDLDEIFSVFGELSSVKVCRNWDNGEPLGYGFINYKYQKDAERALQNYNYKPILGKPCRLMWSTKRSSTVQKEDSAANVFIKGLPKTVDNQLLHEVFDKFGSVLSTRVAVNKKGVSLGYGYVSFASETAADAAIVAVNNTQIHGAFVSVERFVDKHLRNEKPWSNIYVQNIPFDWTTEELKSRFEIYGPIRSAVIICDEVGLSRGFGFVDFDRHESALLAVRDIEANTLLIHEEKSHINDDPVFGPKITVSPALKKVEKVKHRVPRAGKRDSPQNNGRLSSVIYNNTLQDEYKYHSRTSSQMSMRKYVQNCNPHLDMFEYLNPTIPPGYNGYHTRSNFSSFSSSALTPENNMTHEFTLFGDNNDVMYDLGYNKVNNSRLMRKMQSDEGIHSNKFKEFEYTPDLTFLNDISRPQPDERMRKAQAWF